MHSPTHTHTMADTQSAHDARQLPIQRVGIKEVRYPIKLEVAQQIQITSALWSLDVALPADQKGTHMSRFVAWLNTLHAMPEPLTYPVLQQQLGQMLHMLQAQTGCVQAAFHLFLEKTAPVSGVNSLLDYQGRWVAQMQNGVPTLWAEVGVPVKSLCPCSKEISQYGAHNQRSIITIKAELLQAMAWEELIRIAEETASSEIWPLLKRSDEKWVTERAYENPKFVEDLVRDVALRLNTEPRIGRYVVDVENFESIHNHSAFARIER
jgi:GTP cyclohydrolase I